MREDMKETPYNKTNEGYFQIYYKEDGVYLVVYPPVGKEKRIELRDVLDRLAYKKVRDYKRDIVELAVMRADKNPVRIAEPQEEVRIDASVTVLVASDKMKASIIINPPDGGEMASREKIIDVLESHGVVSGIDISTIETITKYPVYNQAIVIAQGTAPINGQNGKVQYNFDLNRNSKPTILEDGRVDFRELDIIESVHKGQVLCTLIHPLPGEPGQTVVGTNIPAIGGKPAIFPRGKNVEISEDGESLIASIDGQVSYIDGKVNVFLNYEVPADVDNSTGNINFIGNVIVRGNVLSGFTIEAGGNVEVWGVVECAVIRAEGDIILRRGMQGMGKGLLVSGGDIIAKYIENSNIEARANIKSEAIMHSIVKCGNKLELAGKKGLLVGGICRVGKEIVAKVIGSYMATATEVEVGTDPLLKEHYKSIQEEIQNIEEGLKKAEQAITVLKRIESAGNMTPEKHEIMAKSVRTKVYYSNKIKELKEEMIKLELRLQEEARGTIKVYNYIYPGTEVSIGTSSMKIKENLQYCTLYRDGADIRIGSINK